MWKAFLDLLFPPQEGCGFCNSSGRINPKTGMCLSCEGKLEFIRPPYCRKCGRQFPAACSLPVCPECAGQSYAFDLARAVCIYSGVIHDAVHRFKFRHCRKDAQWLGKLILNGMRNYPEILGFDAVVPVPLHKERLLERGYNQAELLGRIIADDYRKPLLSSCLLRTRPTSHQSFLSRQERHVNVKDAFAAEKNRMSLAQLENRKLLLIDDVFTTGSTTDECAKALVNAGAAKVFVLTLATGKAMAKV